MVDIGKLPPVIQPKPTRQVKPAKDNSHSKQSDKKQHAIKNKPQNDNDSHIDEFA